MANDEAVNIFADNMEPKLELGNIIVKISVPNDRMNVRTSETGWVELEIERESRYIAGSDWYWFGTKNPRYYNNENWHLLEVQQEVWNWLIEWELVELRPIGPIDSEYFAAEKLMEWVNGTRSNS